MLFRIDDDKAVVVEIFHGLEDYEKSLNIIAWTLRGLNDDMAANLLFISICGFKLMFESRLALDRKGYPKQDILFCWNY